MFRQVSVLQRTEGSESMGMLSRTNIVLAVLTAIVTLLALNSGVDYAQPNIEILPDMKYSPAYGAFEVNPNFPNGHTLQSPVPGTIARDQTSLAIALAHYGATPEEALRAGEEIENPTLALDEAEQKASTRRGAETFRVFCVVCHGGSGKGDGTVPQYGFPPPPSLQTGKSVQMKGGQLLHVLTYGQGSMPNFAAQLSLAQRWEVINFIRTLQPEQEPEQLESESPTTDAQPANE